MTNLRKKPTDSSQTAVYASFDDEKKPRVKTTGAWSSWLRLLSYCGIAFTLATYLHYRLPSPDTHRGIHPTTGQTQFSEYNAMKTISYLSDTLGYRIVGTVEEQQTADYLENAVRTYKKESQGLVGAPKFDIWVEQKSGTHRFDIMDNMVLKAYTNITNLVVRLSCPASASDPAGVRPCEENAVLINAHFDTTLGSPGATDDGSGIAVMLDIIRVLSQRDWSNYKNAIVFLFNGAEETLQDASHAFITMHDIKDTIRAVVNIDACGTTGREILFQANSREVIEAYKQAPYPHGTVMANDVFRTGLILSDTDFRQFVQYGNLTGIDMAIYKNSYLYHTHLDVTKHLQPGAIQHLGENTLAVVNYLAQNSSLEGIEPTSEIVFFDVHGLFFVVYSWATAYRIQMATAMVCGLLFVYIVAKTHASSPYRSVPNILGAYVKSTLSVVLSAIAALLLPTVVALFLASDSVNRHMAWFAREWYGALIFAPMAFLGSYGVQYLSYCLPGPQHVDVEYGVFISLMLAFGISTVITTQTGVASSYVFWIYCFILLIACLVNEFVLMPKSTGKMQSPKVHKLTYAISVFPLALLYTDYSHALVDIFVPLTGRMGVDTPVDIIVAIIFGMVSFMIFLPSVAHVHRFGKQLLFRILLGLVLVQMAVLGSVLLNGNHPGGWAFPYDDMHPKRIFAQHLKNLTSGENYVAIAEADHGPYIQTIVTSLENELGVQAEPRHGSMHQSDWDSVYPFSAFLGGYRFNAGPYIKSHTNDAQVAASDRVLDHLAVPVPKLSVHNEHYDPVTGVRSFTVLCVSPGYTWTVIAFDGHVLKWSIEDSEPLSHESHYVVRHVTGYGNDGWKLDLSVKVPEEHRAEAAAGQWKMRFEFTALDREVFASRGEERLIGGVGILGVVQRILPDWTTATWLSTVVKVWEL
ncbi:uncharacterized protein BYT42DRAFT_582089 [Radiomyces spectabilis]|uniref:uncharacterized protein n=1 Tax=Radiomyces spectabilis TaxID=64574 RepID=UPI0022203BDC|nr:uncharacterized protein BYT42DRAFT_582089 [Radiomyces spectabilis]KAI8370366.1 hypothetical protein BYT42DRAFT_582089 [Radiomyces spectabilis]